MHIAEAKFGNGANPDPFYPDHNLLPIGRRGHKRKKIPTNKRGKEREKVKEREEC